jgi:hypothetical protein
MGLNYATQLEVIGFDYLVGIPVRSIFISFKHLYLLLCCQMIQRYFHPTTLNEDSTSVLSVSWKEAS